MLDETSKKGIESGDIMPIHKPTFPAPPVFFEGVETQIVEFRVDPAVIQAHLPAPLKADPSGRVVAVSLRVPRSNSGPFLEAGLFIGCSYEGKVGVFNSHLYLDNPSAITAGRELWGYPKEFAHIRFTEHEGVLTCEVERQGATILKISTACHDPVDEASLPSMAPHFNLKLIPRADGPGPALKQLLRSNQEPYGESRQYVGTGSVSFGGSALTNLSAFSPLEILSSHCHIGNLREDYHTIVHDYLA